MRLSMKKLRWAFWKFRRKREDSKAAPVVDAATEPTGPAEAKTAAVLSNSAKRDPAGAVTKKRRIHLGIDFGTSTSKIVFRDYGAPGGERAVLLVRDGSFRIPSRACVTSTDLLFGSDKTPEGSDVFESIKMQAVAEKSGNLNYYFGPATTFPTKDGFRAADLATLVVWFLISEGQRAVSQYVGGSMDRLSIGMTMGVPMSFFNDRQLRPLFLSIARRAWHLFRSEGPIGSRLSIARASEVLHQASSVLLPEIPSDQVRDWIRSEGEAAMWWPFQSPAVAAGPYAKLDIGAGTSHSSLYRIFGDMRTPKRGIAFLGAATVAVAMDAVDRAIAQCQGIDGDCLALRGQEQSMLERSSKVRNAVVPVRNQIYDAYRKAWIQTYRKIENYPAEITAWREHRIFTIGGGSLVRALVDPMRTHPSGANPHIQPTFLEPPPDLARTDGKKIHKDDLPFISVAYGLSNIGLSIPEAFTPDEVPPMPEPFERRIHLDRDDIYAK